MQCHKIAECIIFLLIFDNSLDAYKNSLKKHKYSAKHVGIYAQCEVETTFMTNFKVVTLNRCDKYMFVYFLDVFFFFKFCF